MADYRQTTVEGISWQRCNSVSIGNPHEGVASVRFGEEVVTKIGDKTIIQGAEGVIFDFDPSIVIEIRDSNDEVIPGKTMTGYELYVAIRSLYLQKAYERDAVHELNQLAAVAQVLSNE